MSFTGRIRLYLVLIAVLPPLVILGVTYFYASDQAAQNYRLSASEDLQRMLRYNSQYIESLRDAVGRAAASDWWRKVRHAYRRGRMSEITADASRFGFDFIEVLDSNSRVIASAHRPGLVGEIVSRPKPLESGAGLTIGTTAEYDIEGAHASMTAFDFESGSPSLYAGWYLEREYIPMLQQLADGAVELVYTTPGDTAQHYDRMQPRTLYQTGDEYEAVLAGGGSLGFYLVAHLLPPERPDYLGTYVGVIAIVALMSVLVAVAVGLYISGKAKREIDNLVVAFGRVAEGDLGTTVMAYEEGEFSQLADSFSEMVLKVKGSQKRLATAERIAAWQSIARMIAHEVKNPLTPIAVSADDLRRSYEEKLPGFDQTLQQNTAMIRGEVNRLRKLLDEFVSFARMKPPEKRSAAISTITARLRTLYSEEIANGRLEVRLRGDDSTVSLDPEQIEQALVNLIKNGLEASDGSHVAARIETDDKVLKIIVEDNGPGFPDDLLSGELQPYMTTKEGGSGLGLVICQRIVHDHGGSMELSNGEKGGAVITISLPQT